MIVTTGNCNDIIQINALPHNVQANYLLADKGYDGKAALDAARNIGTKPTIPQHKETKTMRKLDPDIYKTRHMIENLLSHLKQFRSGCNQM